MSLTLRERIERTNFARLNHILIPETPEERARVREHWAVKRFGPAAIGLFRAYTRLGTGVVVAMLFIGMGGLDVGQSSNHLLAALLFGAVVVSLIGRRWFQG